MTIVRRQDFMRGWQLLILIVLNAAFLAAIGALIAMLWSDVGKAARDTTDPAVRYAVSVHAPQPRER
jgi:hypothetical protein